MAMLCDKKNRFFHMTPRKNLDSILKNGLIPAIGERSADCEESIPVVWLFPCFENMENALMNWFGEVWEDYEDETGEDVELVILQIDAPQDFASAFIVCPTDSNGDKFFEAFSVDTIPPAFISEVFCGVL